MGENWIKVKVLNCKDIKVFNFFQKPFIYAAVCILTGDNNRQHEQRTPVDSEGDSNNPEWNYEMLFDLGDHNHHDYNKIFLQFDLRCEGLLGVGERSIGEVRVPFTDLVQGSEGGIVRFVSYEIRSSDGRPNGELNFSFKMNVKEVVPEIMAIQGYPMLNPNPSPNVYPNLYPEYPPLDPYGYDGGYHYNQGYYPPPPLSPQHHMQWSPPPPPVVAYPPPHPPPNGGFGGNYDYNGGYGW